MEKRLNTKIDQYISSFKDLIKNKIVELGIDQHEKSNELASFIYEYQRFAIQKEDLSKRKRIKNSIPVENRCNALRADDERCTRKRKDGHQFCGTHLKGTPNRVQTTENDTRGVFKKLDVSVQDINGILYYIDEFKNIYKPEDIMSGKHNPEVIGKYVITDGKYIIDFNTTV
jgi:hypothetical protein